tara:strand:+ start:172 stop:765 length:594 start_codon:yes stop_codon:yes gene_type:complete
MPIAINGSGTVTGISVGGLPDGIVDADMLASNAVTSAKLASGVGGKVLQVVQTEKTDTFSASTSTDTDVTGMSATITTTGSNKVLVQVVLNAIITTSSSHWGGRMTLLRGSTAINIGDAAGSRIRSTAIIDGDGSLFGLQTGTNYLDNPGAGTHTYKIQVAHSRSKNIVVNRALDDSDNTTYGQRTASTIILKEVAA